ncbi:MAG: hypothetical protein IPH28_19320 [Cytophagaceae bacterium]|nr:hypothetical protein [Cytophagaceae bacterium]MBK9511000.1 hypothetical protein [Cytophagaceae bacterium]MBK9934436.1 hypothetical protein [Cytophagaceae bacterium]MBL0300880.1 hypothetical protein [Cytophagaceae bacterium]MBL0323692.1 hypothetical protein [Cytophagaceae bacterium]
MKKLYLLTIALLVFANATGQKLKPYILAGSSASSIDVVEKTVLEKLKANGFRVEGAYKPVSGKDRVVIAVSNDDLAAAVKKIGGFKGFALALRVALTAENGKVLVSYTNPAYWGRAYFTENWESVAANYERFSAKMKTALSEFDDEAIKDFGSKKGIDVVELKKYHYMAGMPYFKDNVKIKEFASFEEAISTIEANLKSGVKDVRKVYDVKLNGEKMVLYGFALSGADGERLFMPKIDLSSPKHTAFLPYEMLVVGNKVYMLHGRFRIALSFPDLTMSQFMKIVSTPGYIEDKLTEVCK